MAKMDDLELSFELIPVEPQHPNPCVKLYGHGPEGVKCKSCQKLYARQYSKKYWKCQERRETHGAGSDHRVNWQACARYVSREASGTTFEARGEVAGRQGNG